MQEPAPDCEATVSPELIRLIHGLPFAEPERCASELEPSLDTAIAEPPQDGDVPDSLPVDIRAAPPCPVSTVKLRVDGARPIQIRGSKILETALEQSVSDASGFAGSIQSQLSLYGTEDGEIVAHIAAKPGAGLPARPIYRAADLRDPSDLATLVDSATADACFGTTPPGHFRLGLTLSAPSTGQSGIRLPLGSTKSQDTAR